MDITKKPGYRYRIAAIGIFLVAVALRFYALDRNSLWLDEAVFANNSYADFETFVRNTRTSNSAPILLPAVYFALGEAVRDAFSVRILPAVFGSLAVGVLLLLPRVGVPHAVSAVSALWMALSPIQIQYSQEVREYSLSVLVACMIVYAYCHVLTHRQTRPPWSFSLLLFIAPFASYGVCLMALAALAALLLLRLREGCFSRREAVLLSAPLALAMGLSYALTARYQMYVGQAQYLLGYYAPSGIAASLEWAGKEFLGYVEFATGGTAVAAVCIALLVAFSAASLRRILKPDAAAVNLMLLLASLVAGSLLAAFLGLYPFGGLRQHLFAGPLVILCVVTSAWWLIGGIGISARTFLGLSVLGITAVCLPRLSSAYVELEDVVSAVTRELGAVDGKDVYVYYGAIPAVQFHFPDSGFRLATGGRGQTEFTGREIIERMPSCDFYLLFSHVFRNEDRDIVAFLQSQGMLPVGRKAYAGASVVKMRRCDGAAPRQTGTYR